MPQRIIQVPPEQVLDHKGIRVYRTYVDDDVDQPEKYSFVTATGEVFDVRSLDVPSALALVTSRPTPIHAPLGTDMVLFQQTHAYFQARLAWDIWFDKTEPNLIRQALIEAIDWLHIK